MSIEMMAKVWKYDFGHAQQLVLLCLADHAWDDGTHIFPGVRRTAWKTGYEERQIRRILQQLVIDRVLVVTQAHYPGHATEYELHLESATPKPAFIKTTEDIFTEDISEPTADISGVTEDIAMSSQPSLQPSKQPSSKPAGAVSKTSGSTWVQIAHLPHPAPLVSRPNAQDEEAIPAPEPIELEAPQGGNKASRAAYMGTCPECHNKGITQEMDACPGKNCGIPVHWNGSTAADKRYREQANHRTDLVAKARRERRLSPTTDWVLQQARLSSNVPGQVTYIRTKDYHEEEVLQQYVEVMGDHAIRERLLGIVGKPDNRAFARGVIIALLRSLKYTGQDRLAEPTERETTFDEDAQQ